MLWGNVLGKMNGQWLAPRNCSWLFSLQCCRRLYVDTQGIQVTKTKAFEAYTI
jgi:hypothetical protein